MPKEAEQILQVRKVLDELPANPVTNKDYADIARKIDELGSLGTRTDYQGMSPVARSIAEWWSRKGMRGLSPQDRYQRAIAAIAPWGASTWRTLNRLGAGPRMIAEMMQREFNFRKLLTGNWIGSRLALRDPLIGQPGKVPAGREVKGLKGLELERKSPEITEAAE